MDGSLQLAAPYETEGEMDKHKRLDELDITKGMGIILIVLGHLEPGIYLMRFVYSFHLFLFFACSGFVGKRYEKREFIVVILQNVRRLLLPYMFWSVLSQLFDLITGKINIVQALFNILFFNANVGWNAALWFLVALFWSDTICSIIIKTKRLVQFIIGVVLIGLWVLFYEYRVVLPLGLYTIPVSCVFWLIGYWINTYSIIEKVRNQKTPSKIAFLTVMFIICICCGTIHNTVISIYHIQYCSILLTTIAGISGVLFMLVLAVLVNKYDKIKCILKYYGRNTLTILCTHYFVLYLIGIMTKMMIGEDLWRYTSTPKSILFTIVVIILYYSVIVINNILKVKNPSLKYLL